MLISAMSGQHSEDSEGVQFFTAVIIYNFSVLQMNIWLRDLYKLISDNFWHISGMIILSCL